jgi:Tfp pilus assembly protein PilF/TolB-like protein
MKKYLGVLFLMLIAWDLRGAPLTRTIVVFPFVNQSSRPDLTWMSEGFAVALSSRLTGADRFVLGRRERQAAYEELGLNETSPTTLASVYKVAQTLGVDWAVVGSFNLQANQMTARAQLLDMRDLKLSAPVEAGGELADLVDLETSLAWRLLAGHDPTFTVGREEDFRRQFPEVRLDAFESYIRGIMTADPEARARFLTEADRRNHADHRAAFELGRLYFDQKNYSQSVLWLHKLVPSDRRYLESQFLLGVSEYFLGHDKEAAKDFSAVGSQLPLNEVFNNLGVVKYRSGDYAKALEDFNRAAQGNGPNGQFSFNRGVCLWSLKKYPEAAAVLKAALASDSEDAEARLLLADALVKLGDSAGAENERKWLAGHGGPALLPSSLTPESAPQPRVMKNYNGHAYRLLALTIRNSFEARVSHLPPAEHAAAHIERSRGFINSGRPAEAEADLEEAVSLAPTNNEAHLLLARVYEAEGRRRDAATQLEISLRLDNSAAAQLWLAQIYLSQGLHDQALEHAQAALALEPSNSSAAQIVREIREQASDSRSKP